MYGWLPRTGVFCGSSIYCLEEYDSSEHLHSEIISVSQQLIRVARSTLPTAVPSKKHKMWFKDQELSRFAARKKAELVYTRNVHSNRMVRVNGCSSTFTIEHGVLQGYVLSPVLFLLVMDPLVRGLEANHLGPSLHDAYVGAFVHADD